jgi:hypothetical protein
MRTREAYLDPRAPSVDPVGAATFVTLTAAASPGAATTAAGASAASVPAAGQQRQRPAANEFVRIEMMNAEYETSSSESK